MSHTKTAAECRTVKEALDLLHDGVLNRNEQHTIYHWLMHFMNGMHRTVGDALGEPRGALDLSRISILEMLTGAVIHIRETHGRGRGEVHIYRWGGDTSKERAN